MVSLKMLNEEHDQSREQTCQPHFEDSSQYSNASVHKNGIYHQVSIGDSIKEK